MLAFGLFITLIFASLETYFIYQKDLDSLNKQFDQIEISFAQGLSNSLWIIDKKLAQVQIAGILELPNIRYVEIVSDETTFVISGKKPSKEKSLIHKYTLNYENLDEPLNIGTLIVIADLSGIHANAINNFSNSIFYEGISIFIIILLMSFLVNNMILRHIDKMSHFMQETSWKDINKTLKFDRKTNYKYGDELDILANSFNTQRVELHCLY